MSDPRPLSSPSVGDIAKAAGVSKAAASYALRNKPGVSEQTRQSVLEIAKRMGYVPDARLNSFLTQVRESTVKELLPVAWLNNHFDDRDIWHKEKFLTPYLEGASQRSVELGYRLEEVWTREPGFSFRRISDILYNRGIQGVIVSHHVTELDLDWRRFSAIALEGDLHHPRLHRVRTDVLQNLLLAVETVRGLGFQRIGICLDLALDHQTNNALRHAAYYFNSELPPAQRVPPLFHVWGTLKEIQLGTETAIEWIRREKPEVIIGHSNRLVSWAQKCGLQVPDDIGVVHLAIDDDVNDWAGICSNRRAIGAMAVELVTSRMQHRELGLPALPMDALIAGHWSPGWTLRPRSA